MVNEEFQIKKMNKKDSKKKLILAKKEYQNKNYQEAEKLYKELYKNYSSDFSIWDKRFYAWSLYRVYIQGFSGDEEQFLAGELVTELVSQENNSNKENACALTLSVFKIIDYLKDANDYEELVYWTSKLNPEYLNNDPYSFKSDGKKITLASKKEKWYTIRSKALLEIGELIDTIKISKEALEVLDEFRNYSDVWFKWRIALANKDLGEDDFALEYLNEILLTKNEWYILKEIAEIYFFKGDLDDALKYAVDAVLRFGEIDKKIKLYSLLEDILNEKGLNEEAIKHAELIYHIRKENNWDVDEKLTKKLEENGIATDEVKNPKELEKNLKEYWEELKFSNQEKITGIISKVLPHGKAGFINSDDGNSYYFNTHEFKSPKNQLNEGQNVSFFLEDSFDKKKNKKAKQAVNIHSSF